jgi:hypothetical protein
MKPIPTNQIGSKPTVRRIAWTKITFPRVLRFLTLALTLATLNSATLLPHASAQIIPPRIGYSGNIATNTVVRGTLSNSDNRNSRDTGLFTLRTENGETLRAILHEDIRFLTESKFFDSNDRVEVEGIRDGDILIARDVRVLEGNRYLSILRGTVESDVRNGRFTITLNDPGTTTQNRNRTVQVNARSASLNNVRRGDEVELRGTWQGNGRFLYNSVFNADSVSYVGDGDGSYPGDDNYQSGRVTTLRGWVVNDSTAGRDNRFRITLRNNQTVEVRSENTPRLNRNDYVEVRGRWNRDESVFRADSVRTLDSRNEDRNTYRVDFTGTITSFNANNRITVRGDNGRTYEVIAPTNIDRNVSRGDRVRIIGTVGTDGITRAESILLVNTTSYSTIDFTGTITELPGDFVRGYYTVRTNEGRTFRVNYSRTSGLRVGDRVRVRGRMNDSSSNVVDAESIVRIS